MNLISLVATIVYYALNVFVVFMWARLIIDLIRGVRPDWRPRSVLLVLLNVVYAVTDPPMRAVRKVVKPIRTGAIAFDLSWTIVLLAAIIGMYVALAIA
jgi:YggT family protein